MTVINKFVDIFKNSSKTKLFCLFFSFLVCLFIIPFFDSILYYGILSIVLLFVTILFTYKQFKKEFNFNFLILVLPIVIFSLIAVMSYYGQYTLDVVKKVFIPIIFICFLCVGYLLPKIKEFNIKYIFVFLFIFLFIVTIINLIFTMASFPIFYAVRYPNYYLYYDGQISRENFSYMAKALVGFQITFVDIGYYYLFPILLITISCVIAFMSNKNNKFIFVLCASGIVLGFFSILYSFSANGILILFLALFGLIISLIYIKKNRSHQPIKISLIILSVLALIFLIIYVINAQQNNALYAYIRRTSYLDYIFNQNRYALKYNVILKDMFSSSKIAGYPIYNIQGALNNLPSGNYIVDQVMYTGIFGIILFAIFGFISIISLVRYLRIQNISKIEKYLILSFLFTFFLYSLMGGSVLRKIFYDTTQEFYMSPFFILSLMLIGYIFARASIIGEKHA